MATVSLTAYDAKSDGGFVSIALSVRKAAPLPSRYIVTTRTAEVLDAIQAMKAEGEALPGKPGIAISARVVDGRAPAGFKEATKGFTYVNLEA